MSAAGRKMIAGAKEALRMVEDMKPRDPRPAHRGWAPGRYMSHCIVCRSHFAGDKRAFECADCAYSTAAA